MPGAHRKDDLRYCDAKTRVLLQDTVFVNDKLWAVQGDRCDHTLGDLIARYPTKTVYINNILVICAVGDSAKPDGLGHDSTDTKPKTSSDNVFVYSGGGGG